MGSVQTGIQLQDNFTNVILSIISSVNLAVVAMDDMNAAMSSDIDTTTIQAARNEIIQASAAAIQLNEALDNLSSQVHSPSVEAPDFSWHNNSPEVFTNTGTERFQQEMQSANLMMQQLSNTQNVIARQALNTNILPPDAFQDLTALATRIDGIQTRIRQIESNPVNIGTDIANTELERLRGMLHQALTAQEALNNAMQGMDAGAINESYLHLSQTVSSTERYIRDNVDEQGRFNRTVQELHGPITTAQAGFQGWQKAIIVANQGINLVRSTLGRIGVTDMSGAFDRIDTMKRFQKTITTMTGDADQANAALAQLKNTTVGTAYGLDVAAKSTQGFLTRGMSLGTAANQVRIWMDAVSFYGKGTNEQLENVIDAVGKIYSKGTVEAAQLDRLFDAGIGAAEMYAQAVGRSVSEVKDDLTNRKISSAEFLETVTKAMDTGVSANAAKNAGDSWAVTFANMRAAITRGWVSVIESVDNALASQGLPSSMEMVTMFGQKMESALNTVGDAMMLVVGIAVKIGDVLGNAGTFISDNWSLISPVIYGVVTALALYAAFMGVVKVLEMVSTGIKMALVLAEYAHAAATGTAVAATTAQTAAQMGLNTALLSCPLTWIILLIIALIAVVIAVANHIAHMGNTAKTTFGVIAGSVNVVIQFFKNLGLEVANIALGMWEALGTLCDNMQTAFYNAISSVKSWWYELLSTALTVIENICAALNKLPFVEFDYSGIGAAADDYAAKSLEAANNKRDYVSVSDAFDRGMNTFDTFQKGWVQEAYEAGASWGDGIVDKLKNTFMPEVDFFSGMDHEPNYSGLLNDANGLAGQTADHTGDAAKNAKRAADSVAITHEDLKYLHDIAEREIINRFTTAEITVHQTNHNAINDSMDLDGVTEHLRTTIEEQMAASAEGAH